MFEIVLTGKCNDCPCFELDGMAIIADSGVVVQHTYFAKTKDYVTPSRSTCGRQKNKRGVSAPRSVN